MKKHSLNANGPLVLIFCAAVLLADSSPAAVDTWNQTAGGTTYSWLDSANWLSGSGFPSAVDGIANLNVNLAGAQTISLNSPITLGTLNIGDTTTPFFAQTVNAGSGGSLIFDVASGTARLVRTASVNPNVTNVINAEVTLNDPVVVSFPWLNNGNGFQINGGISGSGGIRIVSQAYPGTGGTMGQLLDLTNSSNSFAGGVEVANGTLIYRGNVGLTGTSGLGNSVLPLRIGTADSVVGDGDPTLQNNTAAEVRLQASDDSGHYLFARDLDFSGNSGSAAEMGRLRFGLTGNNSGLFNTNTLTVSGNIILPSNNRGTEFLAFRQGQTLHFTGAIDTPDGGTGTIYWGPLGPGFSVVDGPQNGMYRFSDQDRQYLNFQTLAGGTVIIEGNVGPPGLASPIGVQGMSLGDGNGGNLFSVGTSGPNRRIFLETPEARFERDLNPGAGSGSNLETAAAISGVGQTVYQPLYGNSGNINVLNGYEFGGLNTSGTVTFANPITAGNVNVPASGTAGGSGGTNPVSIVHNIALTAATGGTVVFQGSIAGSNEPILEGSTPGAGTAASAARVTINQFRNHPNLDTNVDGLPDANADRTTGTPTGGTVVMSAENSYSGPTEVLGGVLRLDYDFGDASKLSDTAPLILSGGTVEISGGFHSEEVGSTRLTGHTGNAISRTLDAAPLHLNAIEAGPGSALNFTGSGIATTDTLNTNGILGPWATIGYTDFAVNSTNGQDGPITAFSNYTDLTRLASGTKVIPNDATANIRLVEGTGAAADLTLAAAVTSINTLNQSGSGGASAAVISTPSRTLAVNSLLVGNGAGALTIGQGVLQPSATGGSLVIQNGSTGPLTISSVISNNGPAAGLTLANTGRTILTAANTFTGPTGIFGATLQLGDATSDGSLASQQIVNNGALVFHLSGGQTYAGSISGNGSFSKEGAGTLVLTGANSGTGAVTLAQGGIQLGEGGTTGSLPAGSLMTHSGIFSINRSNSVVQGIDFPSVIAGTGSLIKEGSGTVGLNALNTYSGTTTVNTGVLAISHNLALGSAAGQTIIRSDGTLTTGGRVSLSNGIIVPENFLIEGSGDGSTEVPAYNGAITATSGNNTITGTITLTESSGYRLTANNSGTVMNFVNIQRSTDLGGNLILDPGVGAILSVNAPIKNNGGNLICHAGGLVVLNAAGNELGSVTVQNGTSLRIGATDALPVDRNLIVGQFPTNGANGTNNDVGSFDLAGNSQTIDALIGAPNAGTNAVNNATPSNRRLVTSSGSGVSLLTVGFGGGTGSYDGIIENGSGVVALTKTGSGTQTLSGPLTYTGDTTINGGTLRLGPLSQLADSSTVRIDIPGSLLELADGVTDVVGALYLDGVVQPGGTTYGSSSSMADVQNDDYFSGTGMLSVSGTDAYSAWAASFGLQNPWQGTNPSLNGSPAADPDGDGTSNRAEYIFGLNPGSGASASAITGLLDATTGIFSYSRRLPAETGAAFTYQWSSTLTGAWTNFTPSTISSNNASPVEIIQVTIPAALLSNGRLFVRVLAP